MSPQQREIRKREIEAEKIPEEQLLEIVEKVDEENYLVQSFTLEDVAYHVKISGVEVSECNCIDFTFYKNLCKHMYLLLRCFPTFILSMGPRYSNISSDISIPEENSSNLPILTQEIESTELASRFERLGEIIRRNEHSQNILVSLDHLCTKAFKEINETYLAPNSHIERQRR